MRVVAIDLSLRPRMQLQKAIGEEYRRSNYPNSELQT